MARIVTYECEECGTEVVVTETGGTSLRPIYCCGLEITEISSVPDAGGAAKRTAGKAAKTSRKGVKKVAKKRTTKSTGTAKKKTAARKTAKK
ncbi:MAG: hypothetical protein P8Z71_05725 [Candidatus Sulfobium sp.]|jgi:hypothetical protein